MAKTTSITKKKFNLLNPKVALAVVFTLIFSGIGIYYLAQSKAAVLNNITATDGYTGPTNCIDIYGYMIGPYGNFEPCLQYRKSYTEARYGFFLHSTKKFYDKSGWAKVRRPSKGVGMPECSTKTLFFGVGYNGLVEMQTPYGPGLFGYAYDYSTNKAMLGNYNLLTNKCSLENPWYETVGLHR